jgi:hypothetical protein
MRTFDDIVPPSRRREAEPVITLNKPASRFSSDRPPKFPYATLGVVALVIVVSVGALFYFSTAKVEVTPTTLSAAVQTSLTANTTGGALPFTLITAQKIATQSVKGSGTKAVSSSASGTITIYNTQSKSQTLIANTRFATAAGLLFRIHAGVTVPGGTSAKPGSTSVKVYADKPGSTYNVGPTSFTIPGFAGTPLASAVYARSAAAMAGGASGNEPTVDAALDAQTRSALITALSPDLAKSIQAQVPEGYVLLPGAATTTYEAVTSAPSSTAGMVDVKEQGTVTAVVFPNAALAKALAGSVSSLNYQGEPLSLVSTAGLLLAAVNMPEANATTFTFTIAGTAPLVYTVDPARIAAAVAGKDRAAAEVALTNYPEVKRAVITLRPFWRSAFPQDPSSIKIVVANP